MHCVHYVFVFLYLLCPFVFSDCVTDQQETWCGCGNGKTALGPCVGGECPDGYTCVCDYCCEGCFDDCYDCALYTQYCENANYCELRQKCKRTCGLCNDIDVDGG